MTAQQASRALEQLHEDERQIRNLIARLAHLADYGDLDEYMSLFTEDAVWDLVDGSCRGHAAIRADRVHRRGSGAQGPGSHTRHVNTTLWIEVDGTDVASAHSYFLFIRAADGTPTLGLTGRYHDTLRRTPNGWKMAHRRIVLAD
jgi:3-phenylpropionate/cinnamic acid dioxygenase small subunit